MVDIDPLDEFAADPQDLSQAVKSVLAHEGSWIRGVR